MPKIPFDPEEYPILSFMTNWSYKRVKTYYYLIRKLDYTPRNARRLSHLDDKGLNKVIANQLIKLTVIERKINLSPVQQEKLTRFKSRQWNLWSRLAAKAREAKIRNESYGVPIPRGINVDRDGYPPEILRLVNQINDDLRLDRRSSFGYRVAQKVYVFGLSVNEAISQTDRYSSDFQISEKVLS